MSAHFENARTARALILSASLFASSACGPRTMQPFEPPSGSQSIAVIVTNQAWWDVDVYQVDGSTSWRLGRVTALGTASFRLGTQAGVVRLVLRPLASSDAVPLEEVWVTPGGRVELFIAPRLERSTLLARPTVR